MAPHQQNPDMGSDTESIIKDCMLHFQLTSPHTPWGELTFRSYRSTNITIENEKRDDTGRHNLSSPQMCWNWTGGKKVGSDMNMCNDVFDML